MSKDINEIKKIIEDLRMIDLETEDLETLKEQMVPLFVGYMVTTKKFRERTALYRGVVWDSKPSNSSQLGYPPSSKVSTFQRVNRPGQPVFYCSFALQSTVFELEPTPGDCIAVSKWRTSAPLLVNNVGYTKGLFHTMGASRDFPGWCKHSHPNEMLRRNKEIRQFFAREFTKRVPKGKEYLFKLPVAIAEKHFDDSHFGGLMYPALAMKANADNLAIKPEWVDSCLALEKVEFIRVDPTEEELKYTITVLDRANSFATDGTIQWQGSPGRWHLRREGEELFFSVENGEYVARDSDGRVVNREPETHSVSRSFKK